MTTLSPVGTASEMRRGWRILLLSLTGAATTVSVTLLYGFGALVVPLQQAFGWSRGDLQTAIACLSAGVVVASQLAGWAIPRWGLRPVTLWSLALLPLAFLALMQVSGSIGWLYLGFFLVPIVGFGVTFVTWTQLVSLWFVRQRGLALALVLCGSGLSAAVLPPLQTWAIAQWDWRAGIAVLGLLPLVLTLPLAWFQLSLPDDAPASTLGRRDRARDMGSTTFGQHVRSRRFWTLNIALTLVVSAVVGMVTNTVPLLRDMGFSAVDAGRIFSAFGLALIGGRLCAGWMIDRYWAPGVAAVALVMPAIGCALIWQADASTATGLLTFAVCLVGIGAGAEFDLSAYLVSRYFGMVDYPRLFGIHLGLITAGSIAAPLMFGAMYRASGGYAPMLGYAIACCVIGPLMLLTLGRQPPVEGHVAA